MMVGLCRMMRCRIRMVLWRIIELWRWLGRWEVKGEMVVRWDSR